jgi:hypothetical protein
MAKTVRLAFMSISRGSTRLCVDWGDLETAKNYQSSTTREGQSIANDRKPPCIALPFVKGKIT